MKLRHSSLALLVLASAAAAQGRNVTVLGRQGSGFRNDVWGYVTPDGREYALAGSNSGTYILDTTNPRSPIQRGFIGGNRSSWRDIRTYRNYAYIVSEGGGGIQILEMTNPNAPRLIGNVGSFSSHNVAIDTERGFIYPCGTRRGSSGTPIYSLANPRSPSLVTNYGTAYVHDLHIQGGWAHMAEISGRRYRLVDVRNLPTLRLLGSASVSACHNVWPTRDNNYSVTTSETRGGGITVFDIRNKNAPRQIAFWRTGSSSTSAHNAFIKDRVVYAAYYSEGLVCIDISNPSTPVTVGNYDTSSATSGFNGAWGCYPFLPSGNVYITDTQTAFWVLKPRASGTRYGDGTSGTGNVRPEIHKFGAGYIGNRFFKLEVEKGRANRAAILVISTRKANLNAGGLNIHVDLTAPNLQVFGSTDAQGNFSVPFPIPSDAQLDGTVLYTQMFVADPNGALGFAASQGLEFELFNK